MYGDVGTLLYEAAEQLELKVASNPGNPKIVSKYSPTTISRYSFSGRFPGYRFEFTVLFSCAQYYIAAIFIIIFFFF